MASDENEAATSQIQRDEVGEYRVIPVEYVGADELPIMFSDNITVMHAEEHFVIDFYQNQPPLILRPEDALKVESLRTKCIGRFVITPKEMMKLSESLQTAIGKRNRQFNLQTEGGEE
jgi:hypothetical protein